MQINSDYKKWRNFLEKIYRDNFNVNACDICLKKVVSVLSFSMDEEIVLLSERFLTILTLIFPLFKMSHILMWNEVRRLFESRRALITLEGSICGKILSVRPHMVEKLDKWLVDVTTILVATLEHLQNPHVLSQVHAGANQYIYLIVFTSRQIVRPLPAVEFFYSLWLHI